MQRTRGNEELCDSQIKVAKSLESILLKRAQQQVADRTFKCAKRGDVELFQGIKEAPRHVVREASTEP
ncbi:hypothetical protein PF010_g18803 [Phytophthora fragariae]|uniref:Uncharacterized protein n=1 Tax=Phytophthora fragariae TaxID=53985 RepID=A0A6G0KJY2_9STRA|nr:hypothetical protein PF010_g18803 [Phytophthora fragariae]